MFASRNARIFQFMDEREAIIAEVSERVVAAFVARASSPRGGLEYALNEAAYLEMQRLEKGSSKLDMRPYGYWQDLARVVGRADHGTRVRTLTELADAYARDVAGKFTPAVYRFTTSILPVGLSALFNAQRLPHLNASGLAQSFRRLSERVIIEGAVSQLRQLSEIGTLVVVPTHTSNLDSIAVGWALEESGLPPVTYGAGKNLFTNPLTSFFMQNLGAYKVDRRIRHSIYKEVLKVYSQVLLERGYHSLFFPGGTRCRSNVVERDIKLGLLGTALASYTQNLLKRKPNPKIFICPLTINYHLVLEAETLIEDWLRQDGGARYIIEDDEFSDLSRIVQFAMKTMSMEYNIYMRFGEPLDPFGNPVDLAGVSRDPADRPIDIERYLWVDGDVKADPARDRVYTRECGKAVARSFRHNTVAVSSSFLALVLLQTLKDTWPGLDMYQLLRVARGEVVTWEAMGRRAERLQRALKQMARQRRICLSHAVERLTPRELIEKGAEVLSMYHTRPVVTPAAGGLEVGHPSLLLFYANRLAGYGLEAAVSEVAGAAAADRNGGAR